MGKRNRQKQVEKVEPKEHISWILESSGLSGGVRVIYEYAKRLAQKNWNIDFVSLEDKPKWFNIGNLEWKKFADYNALANHVHNSDPSHKFIASWWKTAFVLGKVKHPQSYYIVQDDESFYYTSLAQKDHVRETYILPLKKFTTSHWVENNVFDTTYIGIGVDVIEHSKWFDKAKKRQAMLIGRRQYIKGLSYQMEVAQRFTREMSLPIEVAAVDGGYQLSGMTHINLGLDDKQMARLYGESAYFVNCSYHEGWSIPNIEAMAAGCCVVTTDNDGCRDYAVDGENCLIVDRLDPRQMVEAVRRLEVDKVLRDKLRAGGKKTASEWKWEPVIERLDKYFLTV